MTRSEPHCTKAQLLPYFNSSRLFKKGQAMSTIRFCLVFAAIATVISCGTTNSGEMYDPNAPVAAITISTSGSIDPTSLSIALPAGDDSLLTALKTAFTKDGWVTSTSTTDTRYLMQLQTTMWTYNNALSSIHMTIVDERNGTEVLTGDRKMYGPNDHPIDVDAVADMVVTSLRKMVSP